MGVRSQIDPTSYEKIILSQNTSAQTAVTGGTAYTYPWASVIYDAGKGPNISAEMWKPGQADKSRIYAPTQGTYLLEWMFPWSSGAGHQNSFWFAVNGSGYSSALDFEYPSDTRVRTKQLIGTVQMNRGDSVACCFMGEYSNYTTISSGYYIAPRLIVQRIPSR